MIGVCTYDKTSNRKILRHAYESYYENIRLRVPKENLLEIKLGEWEPMCEFLTKEVPDQPFPHINEAKTLQDEFAALQMSFVKAGLLKLSKMMLLGGGGIAAAMCFARARGMR
jgi:hypothetical protein